MVTSSYNYKGTRDLTRPPPNWAVAHPVPEPSVCGSDIYETLASCAVWNRARPGPRAQPRFLDRRHPMACTLPPQY